jgi:hypothetical protein
MTFLRYPVDLVITQEDVADSGWRDTTHEVAGQGYDALSCAFANAAQQAIDSGRLGSGKVLWLIADACAMRLHPDSFNEALQESIAPMGYRTVGLRDLSSSDLDAFENIADGVTEPWLGARLHDLLWLSRRQRGVSRAWLAIDAYRKIPLGGDEWARDGHQAWRRAVALVTGPGKGRVGLVSEVHEQLFYAIRVVSKANWYVARDLAELLERFELSDDQQKGVAEKLSTLAGEFVDDPEQISATVCGILYSISSRWFRAAGDGVRAASATVGQAESLVREAQARLAPPQPSHGAAAGFYEEAIQVYRRIPRKERAGQNVDERIAMLRALLTEAGGRTLEEMGHVGGESVDLSDDTERARQLVSGKQLMDGLLAFFSLVPRVDVPILRDLVQKRLSEPSLSEPSLYRMFPKTVVAGDGRVIAKVAAMRAESNPADHCNEEVVRYEMVREYVFRCRTYVIAVILPALDVLRIEHRFTESDLLEVVGRSPIVPAGRERLFSKALFAGFEHDFIGALHILVPQVEHMVRYHLKQRGVHTTTIDKDGVETENGLSTLLDRAEAASIFGDSLKFELQSLFTQPFGPNLRNQVAHGLLDAGECQSAEAVCAWWLVMSIVFHSFRNTREAKSRTLGVGKI